MAGDWRLAVSGDGGGVTGSGLGCAAVACSSIYSALSREQQRPNVCFVVRGHV